jgi:DeoR/GlpR family transcriptional regulator of sugar metabolism
MQLLAHQNVQTIFIGGRLSHDAQIALGAETIQTIAQIKADLCFLGTGHLDLTQGLSEVDWEVVQLKKAMIQSSKKVVSLTFSEKINSSQAYKVCDIKSIHTLITELNPSDQFLYPFKKLGLEIL